MSPSCEGSLRTETSPWISGTRSARAMYRKLLAARASIGPSTHSTPEIAKNETTAPGGGKINMDAMVTDADLIGLDGVQEAFEALVKPTTQLQMVVEPWSD